MGSHCEKGASNAELCNARRIEVRIRVLGGEVEGEKAVTRYIFEQARRNGDNLAAVKSELEAIKARLDNHDGEFALLKTVLTSHTALLNVLVQDVGLIRAALASRDPPPR